MKTKTQPKVRKASWTCLDLAFKIQTRTHAEKLVLLYLAKSVNSSLSCYPSYAAIALHTGVKNKTSISNAIQYLRDTLKVVKWRKGSAKRHEANRYMFDLSQMHKVSTKQASTAAGLGAGTQAVPDDDERTSTATGLGAGPLADRASPIFDEAGTATVPQHSVKQLSIEQRSKKEPSMKRAGEVVEKDGVLILVEEN